MALVYLAASLIPIGKDDRTGFIHPVRYLWDLNLLFKNDLAFWEDT